MKPERDYIGPDPVAWVDRLLNVNDGSAFASVEKAVIQQALNKLRDTLRDLRSAPEV